MTLVERDGPSALQPEFPTHPQPDLLATRRTFLKAAGFSFAGTDGGKLPAGAPACAAADSAARTDSRTWLCVCVHVPRMRGAMRAARHDARRPAHEDRGQSGSPALRRRDVCRRAGVDPRALRQPPPRPSAQKPRAHDVAGCRCRDGGEAGRSAFDRRGGSPPDRHDYEPDHRLGNRWLHRRLPECQARSVRPDLGVRGARRPCPDAWCADPSSLPLRSRRPDRQLRR